MSEYGRSLVWLAATLVTGAATLTLVGFGTVVLEKDSNSAGGWWLIVGAMPVAGLTAFFRWKSTALLRKRIGR